MNIRRLRWACQRGMLELDLMLIPFFEAQKGVLSDEDLRNLQMLLTESDPVLYSWLMGKETPTKPELNDVVQKIIIYHRMPVKP